MDNKFTKAALVTALASVSGLAQAASFQLLEQSPAHMGKAFAGTGSDITDASTVFFNPAGMTKLDRLTLTGGLNVVATDAEFHDHDSSFSGGNGSTKENGYIPNAYLVAPLSDSFAVGFGLSAPFGLASRFDEQWAGRYSATDSELEVVNLNVTAAWAVNDMISLGLGVNYQTIEATLENQFDSTLGVAPDPSTDSSAKIKGDDDDYVLDASILFTPSESTSIGFVWREGGEFTLDGDASFDLNAACSPGAGYPLPTGITTGTGCFGALTALEGGINASVKLPDTYTLSFSQALSPSWKIHADIAQTEWSSIKNIAVVTDGGAPVDALNLQYDDTMRYALGTTIGRDGHLQWRFGVALDETPQDNPEYVSPRIPDADRTWLAAGVHWPLAEHISFDFSYAHLFVDDAQLEEEGTSAIGAPTRLAGEFDATVDIFAAQVNWRF
ncbi:OmpP1/FadL family transporter [Gilvimarinus sp. DA14]|uniref:OmpP1/FadL family transporter n=1 Tax=Gilvimarinus sp. DA14 TaxID=2956798 RepID=UPI0020B6DE8D|nr:outer membrane protein transport protein [Gilvimarinus sp. DA14]UTF58737.1 OmpP1/FadL family transporter [Gilvimarinus sp. DA14]